MGLITISMTTLPGTFFLSPMAELTTPGLRRIVKEYCPEAVLCSEMLSSGAIVSRAPHNAPLILRTEFDDPYIYQIVGSEPAVMSEACAILSAGGCFSVDINMGCAAPDILKKGAGAGLLARFDLAREVVRSCRKACISRLSVKMRSGFDKNDEERLLEFIRMLEDEGVDFITLHPRYAKLGFTRTADWNLVALAKKHARVPLIGNGDIESAHNAMERLGESGCDGIMIGREAVRSPWILRLCRALEEGRSDAFDVDLHALFLRGLDYIRLYLPERLHKSRSHRFSFYFSHNVVFGHALFKGIRNTESIDRMKEIVDDYFARNPHEALRRISI